MKTIKQIISDADPRLKGVLVIMVVYVMVMATTVTSGATQEIKGYKETIEIQYQDGGQETKDYLVRQDTVKNVLKELDVSLNAKDTGHARTRRGGATSPRRRHRHPQQPPQPRRRPGRRTPPLRGPARNLVLL